MKQRVLYAEVMGVGKTVMEVEPEGTAAIEFSNLFLEVLGWAGCAVEFKKRDRKDIYAMAEDAIAIGKQLIEGHEKEREATAMRYLFPPTSNIV